MISSPELCPLRKPNELHQELISNHPIPRRLTTNSSPVMFQALHGFSDASTVTYGAAVYPHTMHQDTCVSMTLITPKARVAPLKSTTIPRLELVAAYILAKLFHYIAKLFDLPRVQIFGWTDSEIILCWLRKATSSLNTYVSHRVAAIQDVIPANHWHHVPTKENPADLLSRSMTPNWLVESSLWWRGPDWLSLHQNVAGCKSTACKVNRVKSSKDKEDPYLSLTRSSCNASLYAQTSQRVAGGATVHARCATNLK